MSSAWRLALESYGGLAIHSAPGVHAAAAAMLGSHSVGRRGVLDLGSGSGAFLARLSDMGFDDLHAIEREPSRFGLAGISPQVLDLEKNFAPLVGRRFALVTAIEVVEHLECPLHLLRSTAEVLEPGGHLLLTSPNVAEWKSRLKLLLRGEPRYFGLADYHYQRHISPLVPCLVPELLREAGLRLVEMSTAGGFEGWLKRAVQRPLSVPFGRAGRGDCLIVLACKA